MQILIKVKKYYKTFICLLLLPFILPLMNLIIEILFNSGNCIGTLIRRFSEEIMC